MHNAVDMGWHATCVAVTCQTGSICHDTHYCGCRYVLQKNQESTPSLRDSNMTCRTKVKEKAMPVGNYDGSLRM